MHVYCLFASQSAFLSRRVEMEKRKDKVLRGVGLRWHGGAMRALYSRHKSKMHVSYPIYINVACARLLAGNTGIKFLQERERRVRFKKVINFEFYYRIKTRCLCLYKQKYTVRYWGVLSSTRILKSFKKFFKNSFLIKFYFGHIVYNQCFYITIH